MHGGDDAMHVFTHSFDYIALGVLIACMLGAAARVFAQSITVVQGGYF